MIKYTIKNTKPYDSNISLHLYIYFKKNSVQRIPNGTKMSELSIQVAYILYNSLLESFQLSVLNNSCYCIVVIIIITLPDNTKLLWKISMDVLLCKYVIQFVFQVNEQCEYVLQNWNNHNNNCFFLSRCFQCFAWLFWKSSRPSTYAFFTYILHTNTSKHVCIWYAFTYPSIKISCFLAFVFVRKSF